MSNRRLPAVTDTFVIDNAVPDFLPELSTQIANEVLAAKRAMQKGMTHIREAGRLLVEAKDQVPHGQWLSWLSRHCYLEDSTAQLYMRIYEHWEWLMSKTDGNPDLLNVTKARQLIQHGGRRPRTKRQAVERCPTCGMKLRRPLKMHRAFPPQKKAGSRKRSAAK